MVLVCSSLTTSLEEVIRLRDRFVPRCNHSLLWLSACVSRVGHRYNTVDGV